MSSNDLPDVNDIGLQRLAALHNMLAQCRESGFPMPALQEWQVDVIAAMYTGKPPQIPIEPITIHPWLPGDDHA